MIDGGNFVTKVIYLPDPKYQELAVSGVETLVSTRLEPGVDPILEADKRGTILLIVRLGAIDLESPGGGHVFGGAMMAPAGTAAVDGGAVYHDPVPAGPSGVTELPPGGVPPGVTRCPAPPTVVLDPTSPAAPPSSAGRRRSPPHPPRLCLRPPKAPRLCLRPGRHLRARPGCLRHENGGLRILGVGLATRRGRSH